MKQISAETPNLSLDYKLDQLLQKPNQKDESSVLFFNYLYDLLIEIKWDKNMSMGELEQIIKQRINPKCLKYVFVKENYLS